MNLSDFAECTDQVHQLESEQSSQDQFYCLWSLSEIDSSNFPRFFSCNNLSQQSAVQGQEKNNWQSRTSLEA